MKDHSQAFNYVHNFNPLEKILEQSEKIEGLYTELLKSEREKNELLIKTNETLQEILKRFDR